MKHNSKKRLTVVLFSAILLITFCGCGASGQKENSPKTAEATTESPAEKTTEEKNDFGLTDSQMKEICSAIEKNLHKQYLDPENIKEEDFSFPNDDKSWNYFKRYCMIKMEEPDISADRMEKLLSGMYPISKENQKIITITASSFYDSLVESGQTEFIKNFQTYDDSFLDRIKDAIILNVF